jgi:ribonuclease D
VVEVRGDADDPAYNGYTCVKGRELPDSHNSEDRLHHSLVRNDAGEIGFDTESKPTFFKGQTSEGPHVLQFATREKAFIFQSHVAESHAAIIDLLKETQVMKIGFGLGGDLTQISNRFGIRPSSIVDLDRSFRKLGYRNAVGAKSAVAMLLQQNLTKSKSVTTSNWAAHELTERQLIYAANDAYAALLIHHALKGSPPAA